MRIAHIIMAHKNPNQLHRLIRKLEHPNSHIFIHLDKKVAIDDFKYLSNINRVFFVSKRVECNWGGHSFFNAILNSINEVLKEPTIFDFINLLSAQDYPLISANAINDFFETKIGYNFMSFETSKNSEWWKTAIYRFQKYHLTDYNFTGRYFLEKLINKIFNPRKFPLNMELYGGSKSSWWTITGDCANYICDTLDNNRRLNSFFRFSWGSDEFLLTTIVMNSKFKKFTINNNLRYIDWSEGNARPKTLLSEDFISINNSEMLFGRKFDIEVDENILNLLDKLIEENLKLTIKI